LENKEQRILVGKLGRTRGLQGQIWITPLTDFPDRFEGLKEILVGDRDGWRPYKIEATWMIGERPVIKFVGINSREDASRMTNRMLAVTGDQLVELPEATYYVFDLVGCEVVDETTGEKLGEVTDVRRYPANDVYVVRSDDGAEVLFPAIVEMVTTIDIESKKIVVRSGGFFDKAEEKTE
jgi:16S rRNA processing protein RimM